MPRKSNSFWRPKGYSYTIKKKKGTDSNKSTGLCLGESFPLQPTFSFEYLRQCSRSIPLPDGWTVLSRTRDVVFSKIEGESEYKISRSVTVHENLQWDVTVHGQTVNSGNSAFQHVSSVLIGVNMLTKLVNLVAGCNICCGNHDAHFIKMVCGNEELVKAVTFRTESDVSAYIEDCYSGKSVHGVSYNKTIRSKNCDIITEKNRCHSCMKSRSSLRSAWHRKTNKKDEDRSSLYSHTNLRYLSSEELKERATSLQKDRKSIKKSHFRLIKNVTSDGMQLQQHLNSDFTLIMEEKSKEVYEAFPENSFQRLLWEEQLKNARCMDSRQMRWHPTLIRWCLSLRFKSAAAYDALRNSGFITLPSRRTLSDYTNYVRPEPGINPKVLEELIAESKVNSLEEHDRFVVLLHDEVKIKSDLVFDKNTGELIGFVNLGKVNEELASLAQSSVDDHSPPPLATHVLVFMARAVSTGFCASVAYYPTIGCTADNMFPLLWRIIAYLEITCLLKVIASTSDGATWNRKLYKMHRVNGAPDGLLVNKGPNMFSQDDRMVYFFSDVPHLIKTTRNCFANSEAHRKSRRLWNNGHPILWHHLTKLVTTDQARNIHLLHKIGYEHIELTSFSIMRVNLAAQVLSESVANAMELFGPPEASETAKFIRLMDRFFDCLNVRNYDEHQRKRKPNLKPYEDQNDPRFEWLLKYFDDWEMSILSREGNFSKSARNAMCISRQTIEGLKMTVNSFVDVARYLLGQGVQFILSERFCQDPLEAHFSKHRHRGGANNDPTVSAFGYQENSIRIQKSHHLKSVTGNTGRFKRQPMEQVIDDTPLSKRSRR